MKKDFISIYDVSREWIEEVFELAKQVKKRLKSGEVYQPLKGKTLAMIFAKPSARTRISFEVGMYQLGGHALNLGMDSIQIGKREAPRDISKLLSRMCDGIMARLFSHQDIVEIAENSTIPVINGLTDFLHPCQIMADVFTILEKRDKLNELKIVYIGDGNNVVNSWLNFACKIPLHLVLVIPEVYDPDPIIFERAVESGVSSIAVHRDPFEAAKNADVLYTDVWASMGQESERAKRSGDFHRFQINKQILDVAGRDCLVMHCLPAHRGEEITAEVLDGTQSIVFDEAENRMHVQKAILVKLLK